MFKTLLISSALLVSGAQAFASNVHIAAAEIATAFTQDLRPQALINWRIGDSADYKLSGSLTNGTMHMFVREEVPEGFWLQQDLALGLMGKHKAESLIDRNNGKVIEFRLDGNKQDPPAAEDMEVVDSHKDSITVPKGTFECMWVKLHDKKQNQDSEVWVNPNIVPISGMIKTISQSQFGPVTAELTDFHHAK